MPLCNLLAIPIHCCISCSMEIAIELHGSHAMRALVKLHKNIPTVEAWCNLM